VALYLCLIKIVLLTVLGTQLCAVTSYQFPAYQVKMIRYLNRCPEDFLYGFGVVPAEIGNCVMIRPEAFKKPNNLNIPAAFFLQVTR
jgi:hypothetical protein